MSKMTEAEFDNGVTAIFELVEKLYGYSVLSELSGTEFVNDLSDIAYQCGIMEEGE